MSVINFPGGSITESPPSQEDKLNSIREDISKLEEYVEESEEHIDGVLMITFSNNECRHWISPGLSVGDVYFMLGRIQNALLEYADNVTE
jgi:hypothetical protein